MKNSYLSQAFIDNALECSIVKGANVLAVLSSSSLTQANLYTLYIVKIEFRLFREPRFLILTGENYPNSKDILRGLKTFSEMTDVYLSQDKLDQIFHDFMKEA